MVQFKLTIAAIVLATAVAWGGPAMRQQWQVSDVGMNYKTLRQFLAKRQWEAAAAETKYLIFQITARQNRPPIGHDWVTKAGVEQFPCRDLQTIDKLWVEASQQRYGFSVQAKLWGLSFDSATVRQDPERWKRYRQHLGWQPREDKEFQPDIEGRLPEPVQSTPDFGDGALSEGQQTLAGAAWLQRVQQCGLHTPKAVPSDAPTD
jgi:hypothetical protein